MNNVHSYSVDPTIYIKAAKEEGLKAIAVISENRINALNVLVEEQFFNQPFEVFKTIENARKWLSQII